MFLLRVSKYKTKHLPLTLQYLWLRGHYVHSKPLPSWSLSSSLGTRQRNESSRNSIRLEQPHKATSRLSRFTQLRSSSPIIQGKREISMVWFGCEDVWVEGRTWWNCVDGIFFLYEEMGRQHSQHAQQTQSLRGGMCLVTSGAVGPHLSCIQGWVVQNKIERQVGDKLWRA